MSSSRGKGEGLLPVVVVDIVTGEPLMLAYASERELSEASRLGLAVFYSRSRGERWVKGATSGSVIHVLQVLLDCDHDAAVYVGYTSRHVCHLGRRTCFHNIAADRRLDVYGELLAETGLHTSVGGDGRVCHPLATWRPPPSPLLAALATSIAADYARPRGVNAVLAPSEPPPLLAGLIAQRLGAALHLAARGEAGGFEAPQSLGELDRVLVVAPWQGDVNGLVEAAAERGATVAGIVVVAGLKGGVEGDVCVLVEAETSGDVGAVVRPGRCSSSLDEGEGS